MDKIDWYYLSTNPNAIHLLEKNLDKIDWEQLCKNPNGIFLLKNNMDKIKNGGNNGFSFIYLSYNPNMLYLFFDYDYDLMKQKNNYFTSELIAYIFHPQRLLRFCKNINIEISDYLDILS
jgi:hypothetical protein